MQPLDPTDPERIGRYRLTHRLGAGGMGRVYLGRTAAGRKVVVKVILPQYAGDAEFRGRFAREAAAAARVGGFHTAPVVDADPDGDPPWIVSAFIPGPSLHEVLVGRGPLPHPTLRVLAVGLAEGLEAIHGAGLTHRDLKPANVLMASDGPRIIDFGIARPSGDSSGLTRTGATLGTPLYMSPEQVDALEVGPASDMFSLGTVLAHAAVGRNPFDAPTLAGIVRNLIGPPPELPEDVPADLRDVITRCWRHAPEQRPTPQEVAETVGDVDPELDWPDFGGGPAGGPATGSATPPPTDRPAHGGGPAWTGSGGSPSEHGGGRAATPSGGIPAYGTGAPAYGVPTGAPRTAVPAGTASRVPESEESLRSESAVFDRLREGGDHAAALAGYERLLPRLRESLGPAHPRTVKLRSRIAACKEGLGDHRAALEEYRSLLPDQAALLGADHIDTLGTRFQIAYQLGELNDHEAALAAYRAVLPDLVRVLGPDHGHTLTVRENITDHLSAVGDHRAALDEHQRLLGDRVRTLGPDHPDTLASRQAVANTLGDLGDDAASLAEHRRLLPDRTRVLGPDHPDTLTTRFEIAYRLGELGDHGAALWEALMLLPDLTRVMGADDPRTLAFRLEIARLHRLQGNPSAAGATLRSLAADLDRLPQGRGTDSLRTRVRVESEVLREWTLPRAPQSGPPPYTG
ncbi:protein kinase domain-containing protein [Nocardiopsis changdeensis]|uniref:Protein kinase n=1 Tax=Nocardiopsis changdeensis TaxID=2831969 RepID=A0ABX8BIB1_9ACTN|nr:MULTISPECIES: serine/threonine-protein kinase [Nocardiopsis]QUX21138.1 protein kinase [Nocardiopsis changdeensis]QYX37067.1 protein kinase [Nocardiopsis sp. MT53]